MSSIFSGNSLALNIFPVHKLFNITMMMKMVSFFQYNKIELLSGYTLKRVIKYLSLLTLFHYEVSFYLFSNIQKKIHKITIDIQSYQL